MCGIIAGFGKKGQKINKSVWKRYVAQRSRGSDGFGFITINDKKVSVYRAEEEKDIEKMLKENESGFIVFHHRFPTSTINCVESTHPIYVSNKELDHDYFVIHNGVLQNENDLRKDHIKLGYDYTTEIIEESTTIYRTKQKTYETERTEVMTFNDSESFAIDLARYIDGCSEKIESIGSIAFVALRINKETGKSEKLYYGHNSGNPLHLEENKDVWFVKSVGGVELKTNVLFELDIKSGKISEREVEIGLPYRYYKANNNTHSTYSYSETEKNTRQLGFRLNNDDDEDIRPDYDDIVSPYDFEEMQNDLYIDKLVDEWIEVDDEIVYWDEFIDTETDRLASSSQSEREKIQTGIQEAQETIADLETKKARIEDDFTFKYGGSADLFEFIEDRLYQKQGDGHQF